MLRNLNTFNRRFPPGKKGKINNNLNWSKIIFYIFLTLHNNLVADKFIIAHHIDSLK